MNMNCEDVSVSIIVPIYNSDLYLRKCIDSVLAQTFQDIQLILVDDGSSDNSGMICDEYAAKYSNISVIHKENGGQSSARNRGLDIAEGKYVYFLDSDDYLLENAIESLYETAENNNADVVFFEAESFLDDAVKPLNEALLGYFEYKRKKCYETENGINQLISLINNDEYYVCVPLHFYKRSYLDKYCIRFVEGIIHEDDLFSAQIYFNNGVFTHLNESLYYRRIRNSSTMTNRSEEWLDYRYVSYLKVYYSISDELKRISDYKDLIVYFAKCTTYTVRNNYSNLHLFRKIKYCLKQLSFRVHALFRYGKYDFDVAYICAGPVLRLLLKAVHYVKIRA